MRLISLFTTQMMRLFTIRRTIRLAKLIRQCSRFSLRNSVFFETIAARSKEETLWEWGGGRKCFLLSASLTHPCFQDPAAL